MPSLITDNLITPDELSDFLKISKSSIYRLIEGRKIAFCKIGGSLRFRKSDINEYVEQSLIEPIK